MTYYLRQVASIYSGYPFRGKVAESKNGSAQVIQMKQVDRFAGISWGSLVSTELPGRSSKRWVEAGDVIFVARGITNYAVVADAPNKPTVLSPHFFQIRVKNAKELLPDFLAWQINQASAQKYLGKSAEGSAVVGIRKSLLAELPIVVPPIHDQLKTIEMIKCWEQEMETIDALADNHRKLMTAIAEKVLNMPKGREDRQ